MEYRNCHAVNAGQAHSPNPEVQNLRPPHRRLRQADSGKIQTVCLLSLSIAAFLTADLAALAGTWTPLTNQAPAGIGTMMLLSDGTVMAQGSSGGGGNTWYRLTPNGKGSYLSGTWSTLASMHDTRLYFSSDVLPNGQLYVAGAEYGTGGSSAEVYNPANNTWTYTPASGVGFSDAISTTLPNGNVLDGPVSPNPAGSTLIYNYLSNSWTTGPSYVRGGYQDEASWVKLADGSILTIDPFGQNSERFIPSLNQWINDSNVPVATYNAALGENGAAFLLPNGHAFFLGGTGNTAIYTPSGNTNPGAWTAGPVIPGGLACEDAPGAMMSNGIILCACGPNSSYAGPTTFFEYNYATNSFAQVGAPNGAEGNPTYVERMLDLPDGNVLYTDGGGQLYEYSPSGSQLAQGQPAIQNISKNSDGSFQLSGYQLTGISEGAAYGDDAQMASSYPIVRITDTSGNVHYAKTYNWNTTSVMQGGTLETTTFTPPSGLPSGALNLQVVANGISSNAIYWAQGVSGTYRLNNVGNSGQSLQATLNTYNGNPNVYYVADTPTGYNGNYQYWQVVTQSNGMYKIINGSQALQLTNELYNNGHGNVPGCYNVVASPTSWNGAQQYWIEVNMGGGKYQLENASNTSLSIQATNDSYYNGSSYVSGAWNLACTPTSSTNAYQQWIFGN